MTNEMGAVDTAFLIVGLIFMLLGVANLTNIITYTPPGIVYFIVGIVFLLWGVSQYRRS